VALPASREDHLITYKTLNPGLVAKQIGILTINKEPIYMMQPPQPREVRYV
jgi:hypothetical protein